MSSALGGMVLTQRGPAQLPSRRSLPLWVVFQELKRAKLIDHEHGSQIAS